MRFVPLLLLEFPVALALFVEEDILVVRITFYFSSTLKVSLPENLGRLLAAISPGSAKWKKFDRDTNHAILREHPPFSFDTTNNLSVPFLIVSLTFCFCTNYYDHSNVHFMHRQSLCSKFWSTVVGSTTVVVPVLVRNGAILLMFRVRRRRRPIDTNTRNCTTMTISYSSNSGLYPW